MGCTERPEWLVSAASLVMPWVTITPVMLSRNVTCGPWSGPGIGNVIVIMVMASHRITYILLVSGGKCLRKMLIIKNIFFASDEPVKHIV